VQAIPDGELWAARCEARARLVEYARGRSALDRLLRGEDLEVARAIVDGLDPDALTLGFARRLATYKRVDLLVHDPDRLLRLLGGDRPVQLLVAGKAHPQDEGGKEMLQRLFGAKAGGGPAARLVFLEDYDIDVARHLVAGCDVWINLPRHPLEASGTSGMKATFNGVLQLSILDGWWAEAFDGSNGWGIVGSSEDDLAAADEQDAARFYELLEHNVVPTFYERDEHGVPVRWCELVKRALVTCAPRFTATRMLADYASRLYPAPPG
jgi:glycogen phosphorylase